MAYFNHSLHSYHVTLPLPLLHSTHDLTSKDASTLRCEPLHPEYTLPILKICINFIQLSYHLIVDLSKDAVFMYNRAIHDDLAPYSG
jgi:hypothetical protein